MDCNSPISPIIATTSTTKLTTPSTSTKKKADSVEVVLEQDEYSYSPNCDSVFDLSNANFNIVESPQVHNNCRPSPKYQKPEQPFQSPKRQKVSVSSVGGSAVCRICHGGEFSSPVKGEPLISACYCRGTMGLFHRSCLEMWLSTSNRDQCEICKFQYVTERVPRPFTEFLKNPGSTAAKRNLIGDFVCWCILTPLTIASSWLCVAGAVYYADQNRDTVEVPGLVCLAVFLLITYAVWLMVSVRYHYKLWQDWRKRNQHVRVMDIKEAMKRVRTNSAIDKPTTSSGTNHQRTSSLVSVEAPMFEPRWNNTLQVMRSNLAAAAVATSSSTAVIVRFAYPTAPASESSV